VPVGHLPLHGAPVMLSRTFSSSKTAAANWQVPRMRGPGGLGTGHSLLLRSQGEAGRASGKKEEEEGASCGRNAVGGADHRKRYILRQRALWLTGRVRLTCLSVMTGVHRQRLNGHCERIGSSAIVHYSSASQTIPSLLALGRPAVRFRLVPTRFGLAR
jgi:hypothetical protein